MKNMKLYFPRISDNPFTKFLTEFLTWIGCSRLLYLQKFK